MKKNDKKTDFSALSSFVTGASVGIYGVSSFAITGIICPACIILTPTLLGYGLYNYKKGQTNTLK